MAKLYFTFILVMTSQSHKRISLKDSSLSVIQTPIISHLLLSANGIWDYKSKTFFVPSRHPLDTLYRPIRQLPDTFRTSSPHPLRYLPFSSLLYCMKVWFPTRAGVGWWVGGWSPLQNHATSWSNLQDCKISSRAEIPKLDRVWQQWPVPCLTELPYLLSIDPTAVFY